MRIDLDGAITRLADGGLVAIPTETVYGLAGDAGNQAALAAIFATKGRPRFDPLIVHVADAESAWQVAVPDERARRLAAACWPGPLTLVLPRRPSVSDLVTSGLDTVGVRCPAHPLARALLAGLGRPLAAPSANRFGRVSPTTADHVVEQFGDAVPVLDGGPCRVGVESTVLVTAPLPLVLRPGGVAREEIARILGQAVAVADAGERAAATPRQAPGLLASHYAPDCPVVLRPPGAPWRAGPGWARLAFTGVDLPADGLHAVLSPGGDLAEAAAGLFSALRRLAAAGPQGIEAELVPAVGLGLAINDRLRRAAGRG